MQRRPAQSFGELHNVPAPVDEHTAAFPLLSQRSCVGVEGGVALGLELGVNVAVAATEGDALGDDLGVAVTAGLGETLEVGVTGLVMAVAVGTACVG